MPQQHESRFSKHELEHSLPERFEMLTGEIPDHLSVKHNACSLSYRALNCRANQVAHSLLNEWKGGAENVVLLLEEPIHHVVAQLGVLKAGKTCVPMDASFPLARQTQILADSGAGLIVTESKHRARAMVLTQERRRILVIDELDPGLPGENPGLSIKPDSLAYVLYTSGSTGGPKGVMQSHRNLLNVARHYHQDLGIGLADRLTSPTSFAYTGTVWALLAALMNRAAFVCTNFDSPIAFARILDDEKITAAQLITSLLRQLMQALDQPLQLPWLRVVYTGGEALHKEDVKRFAQMFSRDCGLLYNFGSTEAGIITHLQVDVNSARQEIFQQDSDDPAFPVGYPVQDTTVLLVDENGVAVPKGQDGEIAVGSGYLSPGYWDDPQLSGQHFLSETAGSPERMYLTGDLGRIRPDGCLIHLGRKDFQVKVRGYRINLEEIENALRAIEDISEAAVSTVDDGQGNTRIVAYVTRRESSELSIHELRQQLEGAVPNYMIPSRFIYLNQLPVGANGKLDRKALPRPNYSRPELDNTFVEPRTDTEKVVCQLWSNILGITPVGVGDNFLDLGGDSISVFRFIGGIKKELNMDLDVKTIFHSPIVEDLAQYLDELTFGSL